jgi:hypothetical protein
MTVNVKEAARKTYEALVAAMLSTCLAIVIPRCNSSKTPGMAVR